MQQDSESLRNQIKKNIKFLINDNKLEEANILIEEYLKLNSYDIEIYSMQAVVYIMQNKTNEAEKVLKEGLISNSENVDLNYNLAYLYEQTEKINMALEYYSKAREYCNDYNMKEEITNFINKIKEKHPHLIVKDRKKIVFFVKQGLDSFLGDIIEGLSDEYETKKIIVTEYNQIDKGMKWADVCWFEWCDELVAYGSKNELAKDKKIICRLHRYEALTEYPKSVEWENVDKLIIVTNHLKKFLVAAIPDIEKKVDIVTIANGVNLEKYELKERKTGFNIAYVGYIHSRKNPVLLLQIINELVKKDKRYKLYIAGEFQESLVELYWNYQVKQMGLEKNVIFQGWQNDISKWLEYKNYILSTSIHESFGYGIAEAMARGIKPVIHNFVFADEVWDKKYLFNSISEAVKMISEEAYNSEEYRIYIQDKYSLEKQIKKIKEILNDNYHDITKNNNFKEIEKILNNKANFDCIKDLTIFIPTHNRGLMLNNDLEKGLKLGKQNKLIVDDGSNKKNKDIINNFIIDKKNYGIEKIINNKDNKGVAKTLKIGVNNISTDYVQFCDDDDILICNNASDIKSSMKKIGKEFAFVIPRYIVNMDLDGNLSLGYDRSEVKDLNCSQILKYLCMTGEMKALRAGGIFKTEAVKTSIPESIFTVSEDYIMISRVLSQFKDQKIYVSDSYLYIRRVANDTISRHIDKNKLFLNLFSMLVSGFYCFKNNIIEKEEFISSIKQRGNLLQKIYGEGRKVSELLVEYLIGEIPIKQLLDKINKHIKYNKLSIFNIPEEILEILKYTKY